MKDKNGENNLSRDIREQSSRERDATELVQVHNWKKKQMIKRTITTPWRILVSRVASTYYLKSPVANKKLQPVHRTEKGGAYTGKTACNSNCLWGAKILDLADTDFKASAKNMWKELKEVRSEEWRKVRWHCPIKQRISMKRLKG